MKIQRDGIITMDSRGRSNCVSVLKKTLSNCLCFSSLYLTEIDGYLAPHINRHAIPLIRFELPLPQRVERRLAYQRMAFNNARLRQIAVFGQHDLDLDRTRDTLGFGFGRQRGRDLLFDVAHKLFLVDQEDAVILGFIRWRRILRRAVATFEGRSFGCRRRVAMLWRGLEVRSRGGDGASRRRSGRWREAGGLFVLLLRFKRQLLGFGEVSVGKRCAGGETRLLCFPP